MDSLLSAQDVEREAARHPDEWWLAWNSPRIASACASAAPEELLAWPLVARWRALGDFMAEKAGALTCLEFAYQGHLKRNDERECLLDAGAALVICLIDVGAMDRVDEWLARARLHAHSPDVGALSSWYCLGTVAQGVLARDEVPQAKAAADWLNRQLAPMHNELSADERLIAAQVLVNYELVQQRYEQFDRLAVAVQHPPLYEAACELMRSRWLYTYGFAHYQIGNHDRAELAWQDALFIATARSLDGMRLVTSLALVRLLIDRGRVVEAAQIAGSIEQKWGAGRPTQLVLLKQMSARLLLLQGQPVLSYALLGEALSLAGQSGLSPSECASCLTDLIQVLWKMDRHDELVRLFAELQQTHRGRDACIYRCLDLLLSARRASGVHDDAAHLKLQEGLHLAQELRYTMFFRLLPDVAAEICALALQWQIESAFVLEVIRSRRLPAPEHADSTWPWPLWIRMLGAFELHADGQLKPENRRAQQKPLELLRLLACQPSLSMGLFEAADELWPEAESSARKNVEMTVQRLRRILEDDSLVRVQENRISLDTTRVCCDVLCRRQLVDELGLLAVRAAGLAPSATLVGAQNAAVLFARVRELGVGNLLPGVASCAWLDHERMRCRREVSEAALAAARVMRHAGNIAGEREVLELAIRADATDEAVAYRLAEAFVGADRQVDAKRIFERFCTAVEHEGGSLGTRSREAFQRLLHGR